MDLSYLPDFKPLMRETVRIWQGMDNKSISTVVVVLGGLLGRSVIVAWLQKSTNLPPHIINRWKQRLYQLTLLAILILLMVIWAPELRTIAVTLVAVAGALVVIFKELITCFMGGFIRASVEGAHTGGRILIHDLHGDVAATDLMSTTILEVNDYGQRTGKTIVLPNSFFISHATVTESADDRKYVLMMVPIPAKRGDNWPQIEKYLLQLGQEISDPYIKEAKKHFARFNRRYGFDAPGPEPKIMIDWNDSEKITISLRMAVPVTEQNALRQQILRSVLTEMYQTVPNPADTEKNSPTGGLFP
jgi:small-conductance mechanosensitive channel